MGSEIEKKDPSPSTGVNDSHFGQYASIMVQAPVLAKGERNTGRLVEY
jgi:hypothetical protein